MFFVCVLLVSGYTTTPIKIYSESLVYVTSCGISVEKIICNFAVWCWKGYDLLGDVVMRMYSRRLREEKASTA